MGSSMLRTLLKDIASKVRGGAARAVEEGAAAAARDGDAYWRSGDTAAARREFERALKLAPAHPGARYALCGLDALQGDFAGADRRLNELLREHPDHVEAWNALGNVMKLQRRWEEAG